MDSHSLTRQLHPCAKSDRKAAQPSRPGSHEMNRVPSNTVTIGTTRIGPGCYNDKKTSRGEFGIDGSQLVSLSCFRPNCRPIACPDRLNLWPRRAGFLPPHPVNMKDGRKKRERTHSLSDCIAESPRALIPPPIKLDGHQVGPSQT